MKNKSQHNKSSLLIAIGAFVVFSLLGASAIAQSTIINMQYNPMSFIDADRTVLLDNGNSGESVGSIHKYPNVATVDGITIYARMTIMEMNNASLFEFDTDSYGGDSRFQPVITPGSGGGSIVYKIEFFDTDTDDPVFLYNYYLTGVDIDGEPSYQEYVEAGGYNSYTVDQTSGLTITTSAVSGRTRFSGITSSNAGIVFENTASFIANYTNPNNVITIALGINNTSPNERYFSVQMGAAGGTFDNPENTNNPLPVAVDDVGTPVSNLTGGTAVPDILDNDTYDGSPIIPADVTISEITPASDPGVSLNTTSGEVTVDPGTPVGNYTIEYQICMDASPSDCDIATIFITVEAPSGPTAVDDNASTDQGLAVLIDVLDNDIDGSSAIDPTSVSLVGATAPDPLTEGTFTVDPVTGEVTFTPVISFAGTATIDYEVCDQNALCDEATISVLVQATTDTDGDGCPDAFDDYPADPDRCFDIYYPADDNGTLAFEDLWPGKGDYDFNDLVLDYRFQTVTNADNKIVEVFGTFTIRAYGAELENGFGFQFADDAISQADISVTGYDLQESFISLNGDGLENGQSKPTFIVYDNTFKVMGDAGLGVGVNTTPGAPYIDPVTLNLYIDIADDLYTYNDLDIANWNPFLIIDKNRSMEVHLPDYPPTDLADTGVFGTWEDDSDGNMGRYYKTSTNLPWAINIVHSFEYPEEKVEISAAYLHFVEWAESGGTLYPDWYSNTAPGYRNDAYIFVKP